MSSEPSNVWSSASAHTWSLFLSCSVTAVLSFRSRSFSTSECCRPLKLNLVFLSFNLSLGVTRWWWLPASAPLLTSTSWQWSPPHPVDRQVVNLVLVFSIGKVTFQPWTSRCGKSVPPVTKSKVVHMSGSLFPLSFMVISFSPHGPIVVSVISNFCIEIFHHNLHLVTWFCSSAWSSSWRCPCCLRHRLLLVHNTGW